MWPPSFHTGQKHLILWQRDPHSPFSVPWCSLPCAWMVPGSCSAGFSPCAPTSGLILDMESLRLGLVVALSSLQ